MMTWQGFPLPLFRRSSNKLEAARGRPRLAPAIARQASRPINPPHPVSQWKQTSFGASSALALLSLCLFLQPNLQQICSIPGTCRLQRARDTERRYRAEDSGTSVICAAAAAVTLSTELAWPGSATSLCTLQSQLVTSGAPEEWWTWIEQINDNTFNVDKTFLTQCRDWETFLKFRVTVLQKYQENVSKFTPSYSR